MVNLLHASRPIGFGLNKRNECLQEHMITIMTNFELRAILK